jgi:hypothetical protein
MNENPDHKVLESIQEHVQTAIDAAFESDEEILARTADAFCDAGLEEEVIRQHAIRFLTSAVEQHLESQKNWPAMTDCDRLDRTFETLESSGIVCRQNYSCCGNCGRAEISEEILKMRASGREVRGYCFYHQQDTESAVRGGGTYLAYGSVLRGEKASVDIGTEIERALQIAGLQTDWDGTLAKRILVKLDWKRRRS